MASSTDFDVLVVGLGPAGATTALFLARYGVKVLAISRYPGTANTPRAHIFNQRAMEVLREAGLEPAALEKAVSADHIQQTTWMHSFTGEEYGRVWAFGNKPSEKHRYEVVSPCKMSDFPQSLLEPILVEAATKAGASLRFGHEYLALQQTADSVTATIRIRATGEEYKVTSKFLVGADGGRSSIIDGLGIPIDGKQIGHAFNVHVRADLTKYVAHRPGSIYWIMSRDNIKPSAVGGFRMVRPWNEWMVGLHAIDVDENGDADKPATEEIRSRLQRMIGDDTIPIDILQVSQWNVNDQVARTWQKDRVLCIGDAVHRHPPVNGLGSNTCISDGYNLAWKIAYVLRGVAGPQLLDSLTAERKPVGDGVVRRAVAGLQPHAGIWSLWGLTAEEQDEHFAVLESATSEGRAARNKQHADLEFTDLEHQAVGIQMNQIYNSSGAIVAEPADQPPSLDGLDLVKEPIMSTYPGHHLPHAWVVANSQSPRVSTLDLCGKGRFTLLTGVGGECWREAASEISASTRDLDLAVHSIGFRCDYEDCYRDWTNLRGVEEDGVVLVRPDHFVAWRYHTRADNATSLLRQVLSKILANPQLLKPT